MKINRNVSVVNWFKRAIGSNAATKTNVVDQDGTICNALEWRPSQNRSNISNLPVTIARGMFRLKKKVNHQIKSLNPIDNDNDYDIFI